MVGIGMAAEDQIDPVGLVVPTNVFDHLFAGLVGAVPLTPNGLGTTELAIEELYKRMPGVQVSPGDGTLVGIGRRVTDIAVALIGLGFYLSHRREVSEVFAEAEEVADAEE